MTDVWFVVAGWGVILGGLAIYAVTLLRRLDAARREAGQVPPQDDTLEGRG